MDISQEIRRIVNIISEYILRLSIKKVIKSEAVNCDVYENFKLIGHNDFKKTTIKAIDYLKSINDHYYSIVRNNIETIIYIKTKYSHQFPKIFGVGDKSVSEYGVKFYASEIVRAAYRNRLEKKYGSYTLYCNKQIYHKAKILSIKKQLRAMHKLKCNNQRIKILQDYLRIIENQILE